MSNLDKKFEKAVSDVTELPSRPANTAMLSLYANFKQATVGDCSGKRPGMLDISGRAKFDAWKNVAGTKSEEAKQAYVDLVTRLQKG